MLTSCSQFYLFFSLISEVNLTADAPPKNKKVQPNSLDDIRIINVHRDATFFDVKMEYLMPYTRLKPAATTGMQLKNFVVKSDQEPYLDDVSLATMKSAKKNQKHALNHQFKHLKNSSEFSPTKMSKKQLKVAQDQLKKLSKINIHLHGKC